MAVSIRTDPVSTAVAAPAIVAVPGVTTSVSQTVPQSESAGVEALEAQVREIFARTVYAHKTQEKCADRFLRQHKVLKNSQFILSAITTGSLLIAMFGDKHVGTVIGAGLSTILFGLSAYAKDYDFGAESQKHADTAHQLWSVREDYVSLLTDIHARAIDSQEIRERRDRLQERLDKIYGSAPRTTPTAYFAAQKALKKDEDMTLSPEEVDAFLPAPLKRSQQSKP